MLPKSPKVDPSLAPKVVHLALFGIAIDANPHHDPNGPAGCKVKVTLRVIRPVNRKKVGRQVQLKVELMPLDNSSHTPYTGHVSVLSEIEFAKSDDDRLLDEVAGWLSITRLVGNARTYIDMVTAIGPFKRIQFGGVSASQLMQNATVQEESGTEKPRRLYPSAVTAQKSKKASPESK